MFFSGEVGERASFCCLCLCIGVGCLGGGGTWW